MTGPPRQQHGGQPVAMAGLRVSKWYQAGQAPFHVRMLSSAGDLADET